MSEPKRMRSYDYAHRKGVREMSWEEFASLAAQVAEGLAECGVDTIVGVARAGLFPATAAACALRCEFYPARITRRIGDQVVYDSPQWKVPVSTEVAGKVVGVVDEIADTGETLSLVGEQVRLLGAKQVVTACVASHSWADPMPDICPLTSDEFVIFPWDRRVLIDGRWQPHPEIVAGLAAQVEREDD